MTTKLVNNEGQGENGRGISTQSKSDAKRLCLGPCRVEYYGNAMLKVRLFGFIGNMWIDVPFMSNEDAKAWAKDHGFVIVYV